MRSLVCTVSSVVALCAAGAAGIAIAQTSAPARPPMKLLMPPPPVNDGTVAYQFRTRVSMAPQCQRFATAADSAFLDERTDIPAKAAMLKKIEAEAQANSCLTAP